MTDNNKNVLSFDEILIRVKAILDTENDKDVAEAIGMKANAFYNRKNKKSIPTTEFVCLATSLNVSIDWLLTGEGPIYKGSPQETPDDSDLDKKVASNLPPELDLTEEIPPAKDHGTEDRIRIPSQTISADPENYHYVPMAKATLNAGGGSFVLSEGTTGKHYAFRKRFLAAVASSARNVIMMKVTGDSMEPKIEDGDTVMIDTGRRQLKNGATYALGYEDLIVVKDVEVMPGGQARIISKNNILYPPYTVDLKDLRIIGQVIWMDRVLYNHV